MKKVSAFSILKEDFKLFFNSWRNLRKLKKLNKKLYERGLISKDSLKVQEVDFKKDHDFLQNIHKYYTKYTGLESGFDISSKINNIVFREPIHDLKEDYQFEANILFNDESYTIHLSFGTWIHFERLVHIFGTLACSVPDIKKLRSFYVSTNEIFYDNFHPDDRTIVERLSKPSNVKFHSADEMEWQAELYPIQGLLAHDMLKGLKSFLIGHEFGHIVNDVSENKPESFKRAEKFCFQNQIPINERWLEEFSCDSIGFSFARKFLIESNYLKNSVGVYDAVPRLNFNNPITFLLSRSNSINSFAAIDSFPEDAGYLDVSVLLISVIKIISNNSSDLFGEHVHNTHPPDNLRLQFLLEEINYNNIPEFFKNFTECIDYMYDSIRSGIAHVDLEHPFVEKLKHAK